MKSKSKKDPLREIGWRENVGLPDLSIHSIKAKIDTGARTSALHAVPRRVYEIDGSPWIEFDVPRSNAHPIINCNSPLVDQRKITNTSGVPEIRYVIETTLVLGRRHWHIELSLADREKMIFDIILGRTALRRHKISVNPGKSFLAGPPEYGSKTAIKA